MFGCNAAATPMEANTRLETSEEEEVVDNTIFKQIVGSLRYLCHSRPDICHSMGIVSRFMESPKKPHLFAAKRILRYIQGTLDYGLWFPVKDREI